MTEHGQAVVGSDGRFADVVELTAVPGTIFHEVWSTEGSPAPVGNGPDPSVGPISLPPPRHGTAHSLRRHSARHRGLPPSRRQDMNAAFTEIGDAHASTVRSDSPHPLMHRTESVDYGVVISGEMTLCSTRARRSCRRAMSSSSAGRTTPGPTDPASLAACCSSWSTAASSRAYREQEADHEICDL